MAQVVVYVSDPCGYCRRAKELLRRKGATFEEVDVSRDPRLRDEMVHRAGGRYTVPQIFINDRHIGGAGDLAALDATGELDELLRAEPVPADGE